MRLLQPRGLGGAQDQPQHMDLASPDAYSPDGPLAEEASTDNPLDETSLRPAVAVMHTLAEEASEAVEAASTDNPLDEAVEGRPEPIADHPKRAPLGAHHNLEEGHRGAASLGDFARAFPAREANRGHNFAVSSYFS